MQRRTSITCVVAHIDHGKTTLMDSLVSAEGAISKVSAGDLRYLDTRRDEQERGITLKLNAVTVEHAHTHVIIDTPGHVDFEHLVQKAAALADSFMVIVDINEGITPRTYALVSHMRGRSAVLVLNKIDKMWRMPFDEFFQRLADVVARINGLAMEDVFEWGRNNVVLACSTMCAGTSAAAFGRLLGPGDASRNTLRNAAKFVHALRQKIDANDVEGIVKRHGLRKRGEKHILSNVLPLAETVLSALESSEPAPTTNTDGGGAASESIPLRGITTFAVLMRPGVLTLENVLFVTRIQSGEIRVGLRVFSRTRSDSRECVVERIFLFGINELKEVESARGPALVCIRSNLLKNSLISDAVENDGDVYVEEKTPFFRTKVVLDDHERQSDDLKRALAALSFVESPLRVKLNRYGEFEFLCQGRVQFEKIANDLEAAGFRFKARDFEPLFAEAATEQVSRAFSHDEGVLRVDVGPSETAGNELVLVGSCEDLVSSVLGLVLTSGPLVAGKIQFTRFTVETEGNPGAFGFLKKAISSAFIEARPTLVPFYDRCTCFVLREYLGQAYSALNKFSFVMIDEDFDVHSQFFVVKALVPQLHYREFVDEIRLVTKGTVYLEFAEHGFHRGGAASFERFVDEIRTRKGLFVEQKLVEDPEKQRTLKK